jgi:hypothetical protein
MKELSYDEFKPFIDSLNYPFVYSENNYMYNVALENKDYFCEINKDGGANVLDFEANFKSKGNAHKALYDESGKPFARFAIAKSGNVLQCFNTTFKTAKQNTLFSQDHKGNDYTFVQYTMYDNTNAITLTDANCVKTVIDFMPPWNYELVGGMMWHKNTPTENVYAYLIAMPDLDPSIGGQHEMCGGGFNLAFLGDNQNFGIDGKAPKELPYNGGIGTNKLRCEFHHPAGFEHDIMFQLRYYKPTIV